MAEAIGIASGAITFATVVVQVGQSILTLKNCWDEMRDAPEDIRKLVREIELLGLILADIEDDLSQDSIYSALQDNKHALKSFNLCKDAAEDLNAICMDLSRDVHPSSRMRRSYKALRIVMQNGKIEKYRSRLQNVIQLLTLSQQCYTRALLQLQPVLIAERIVQGPKRSSDSVAYGSTVVAQANKSSILKGNRGYTNCWRLSLPSWMTSKILEIYGMKAPGGWNWMLRMYNLVPSSSKVVQLVRKGDVKGVQDLFTSGQASPFDLVVDDKYPWGKSLFHYIHEMYTVDTADIAEMVEFLLDQGASQQGPLKDCPEYTALHSLVYLGWIGRDSRSRIPTMRILLPHLDTTEDPTEKNAHELLTIFHGHVEDFLLLQQNCCQFFYKLPLSGRIIVAVTVADTQWFLFPKPELIQTIIGQDILEAEVFQYECYAQHIQRMTTLVHLAARIMGCMQLHSRYDYTASAIMEDPKLLVSLWGSFVQRSLDAHVNIHRYVDGMTPFLEFYWGYHESEYIPEDQRYFFDLALKVWLKTLQKGGVNLERYGRNEERIWKTEWIPRESHQLPDYDRHSRTTKARLIGFSYGPSIEDWHLWVSEPSDSLVGEFWDLIERPVEVMPGAWPINDYEY
ncbi:hypothetical protein PENSOL_c008G11130 [Penicillium solitum]|uniref:NACHT-NTPase and P-loop NTPases N-terminal domain-containing protein n=1 Tax=Penicillium solitum TaxID=60172 RepID=A0A1V6RC96_9EURO|nr:uncharacterized protein PENSOL_c008G11130 [Penicillium solitum]OQD98846.1 hypothetical protein PENSOL_c008G11130 [Penicillium solitum]